MVIKRVTSVTAWKKLWGSRGFLRSTRNRRCYRCVTMLRLCHCLRMEIAVAPPAEISTVTDVTVILYSPRSRPLSGLDRLFRCAGGHPGDTPHRAAARPCGPPVPVTALGAEGELLQCFSPRNPPGRIRSRRKEDGLRPILRFTQAGSASLFCRQTWADMSQSSPLPHKSKSESWVACCAFLPLPGWVAWPDLPGVAGDSTAVAIGLDRLPVCSKSRKSCFPGERLLGAFPGRNHEKHMRRVHRP